MSEYGIQKKPTSEKQIIEQVKDADPIVWQEVSDFMNLLEELGITGYKLIGSVEDPVFTGYEINIG